MMFTACEHSHDLPSNDVRVQHLEQNYPQLKNLRDQIVFQEKTCRQNVDHLMGVRRSFSQEASRNLVDNKIKAVRQQQQQLIAQLNRIDAEVERGIALKEFNTIDGGGERKTEIEALTQESAQRIATAARLNGDVDVAYNGTITTSVNVQPKKITLETYAHLDELPPVDIKRLKQVFDEHPELFDLSDKRGQRFITMIRNLKQHEPRLLENSNWIDIPVKSCTY